MYLIYAPNVRAGGGLMLLKALISGWKGPSRLHAILDDRARGDIVLPPDVDVDWAGPGLLGRLKAEWMLRRAARHANCLFCFHGLPPMMTVSRAGGRIVVFAQNRLVVEHPSLRSYPLRIRLRILLERFLFRKRIAYVDDILVQTPSMQRKVRLLLSPGARAPRIHVCPFTSPISRDSGISEKQFDFIYPASGDAHKNHLKLIDAWEHLKKDGFTPSLALTLGPSDRLLWEALNARVRLVGLSVVNLGSLDYRAMAGAYGRASALIFPSTSESFGLPLIEASTIGLPIVAGELDFVRDVCQPAETFDPDSAVSIARAVKRLLKRPEEQVEVVSPEAFWSTLIHGQWPS